MADQFAWQGLSIHLEDYWRPERVTGSWAEGYLSFAGERDDHLQIRWSSAKAPKDLNKRVLSYFSNLETAARKRKQPFRSELDLLDSGDCEFEWHAGPKGYGRIGWEPITKRIVLVERSGRAGDSFKREAREMWAGLRGHQDGLIPWSLFGLSISLPRMYRFDSFRALSGHITFKFTNRGSRVRAERWGFGNQLVEAKGLEKWALIAMGQMQLEKNGDLLTLRKRLPIYRQNTAFVRHEPEHNRIITLASTHLRGVEPNTDWLKCDF